MQVHTPFKQQHTPLSYSHITWRPLAWAREQNTCWNVRRLCGTIGPTSTFAPFARDIALRPGLGERETWYGWRSNHKLRRWELKEVTTRNRRKFNHGKRWCCQRSDMACDKELPAPSRMSPEGEPRLLHSDQDGTPPLQHVCGYREAPKMENEWHKWTPSSAICVALKWDISFVQFEDNYCCDYIFYTIRTRLKDVYLLQRHMVEACRKLMWRYIGAAFINDNLESWRRKEIMLRFGVSLRKRSMCERISFIK